MKKVLCILFFSLFSFGVHAQNSTMEELNVTSKELANKIVSELNIDGDKEVFLHRAILQTAMNTKNAEKAYANNPSELETLNVKIQEEFEKMLATNFDQNQITAIKGLISAKAE